MGLTKQYLAYQPIGCFNIVASARPNINYITIDTIDGRYVAVGSAENVIVWDLRLGLKIREFKRGKEEVTAIRVSPDKLHLAVGYIDGVIEIFNINTQKSECTLALHKSAISILCYDSIGLKLASGGNDTDVVVSDVIAHQGKYRLSGHTGGITAICFLENIDNVLISSSKDTQIKFWNIETQFCFKTLADHRTEVWGIALMRQNDFLVTGSRDSVLNVYKITENNDPIAAISDIDDITSDIETCPIKCNLVGTMQRGGKGRTVSLLSDSNGQILSCFGTNNQIELFYFYSQEESEKRLTKRLKKLKINNESNDAELTLVDEIRRLPSIKTADKIKSIDLLMGLDNELRVSTVLANNTIQLHSIKALTKDEPKLLRSVERQGHHSEVRCVAFSSDNLGIASGSADSLKLWNRESMNCYRTIKTGYILTTCFAPGDRHVIVGLKSGHLLIVDVVLGEIIEDIPAHTEELWSICLLPNARGCVTGGGDQTVKTWSFELIQDPTNESNQTKVLSLLHQNTLKLEENVLCVKVSPNGKYIAAALLDSTIKIFFLDSFKFFLSLYGHKLPILSMDISYDNALIVTASADRNVKIWGMDFGDCHRSLFAHDDSVMSIQFIPKTHMFFTCGKDGKIKQWDADNFQKIVTLPAGHIGEAYGLAISPNAMFLASCGSDRTIRLFEKTDEIIVLQDAQEEEREETENRVLATGEESHAPGLPGLKLPSRKTIGSERAAESILECLELIKTTSPDDVEFKNIMLAYEAFTPLEYLTSVLSRIRASDLEEALLILPFTSVMELLEKLPELIETRKDQTELLSKVVFFLIRIHHKPIVNNHALRDVIQKLLKQLHDVLTEYRDTIGENLYGLQMLRHNFEENDGVELFADATKAHKIKDKKRKARELKKRLHVHISS